MKYQGTKGIPICKFGKKQNTGSWRVFKPVHDQSKCIRCFQCVKFCPECAIKKNKYPKTDYNICKGCLICVEVCPANCIKAERND